MKNAIVIGACASTAVALAAAFTSSLREPVLAADAAGPAANAVPTRAALESCVKTLASEEYGGRGSPEDREKAAAYVEREMRRVGLREVPGLKSLRVPFAAKDDKPAGCNVVGWVAGASDEYVIVSAHYDHLGRRDGAMYPGADDNASGIAALLETARCLAAGAKPARSVMVVAFDLEEAHLVGSEAFAAAPPLPLDRCAAFVTADMLGRSLADLFPGTLLLMGGERADAFGPLVRGLPAEPDVAIREMGMDFNSLGYSDFVPFEARKVPSLFLTSGACRDYHAPGDTPDRVDYDALLGRAKVLVSLTRGLCALQKRPVWKDTPQPRLLEIESLLAFVKGFGEKEESLGAPPPIRAMRKTFEDKLAATVASGKLDPTERETIRNQALMLFRMATAMK